MATEEKSKADQNGSQEIEGQISEQLGIEAGDATFSMELSQDQQDIRDWAHGFAEQTVRPAAHEWDEKEEFPWPVVQEAALVAALEQGTIAGAALDVFEREPLISDGLRRDNVVLAPHLGSASIETRTRMAMIAVENAVALFSGKQPPTILNPEVLRQQ